MKGYIGIFVLSAAVGAAFWFFGLAVIPSIVVALVLVGLGLTLRLILLPTDNLEWPPGPPEATAGARREVSELTWALRTPRGVVEDRVIERVRAIAAMTLRRRHLDLDDPTHRARIEVLIGPGCYELMTSPESRRVNLPTILSVLAILETLEQSDPASRA